MNKKRILIVEDEAIIALLTKNYLEKLGYIVVGSYSKAEDVLNNYESFEIDLILMDIYLSGDIDGIETARRIKEKKDIPIIFLTANTDTATFTKAKTIKPFGFLSKPFDYNSFVSLINEALNN